ncbi:hypothetical protein ACXYTP_18250 [Tsukamurella ocularis]|uniref:hypothetical protein n=1 Tax=Tsukamurella ocularis TaxID=1970234 RepID=UPI0039EF3B17
MFLPDGTAANARRSRDGTFVVVEPGTPAPTKPRERSDAVEKPSSPDLTESTYRELMAVLAMEDTGRSRRGSL